MSNSPAKVPKTYGAFVREFPKLGEAWESMRAAEESGPFAERELRLLKVAIAIGAGREGAVHSSVRKARAAGCADAEIRHVVALAASTIGLPAAVAAYSWIEDELRKDGLEAAETAEKSPRKG